MKPAYDEIEAGILDAVREMTADWDLELDDLGPQSGLVADICFSSVDFLHLMAAVEMKFGKKLSYESLLIQDGGYRTELTVGELARFVHENYEQEEPGPVPA